MATSSSTLLSSSSSSAAALPRRPSHASSFPIDMLDDVDGEIDVLLAESGYKVRPSDLPHLVERIEQLESLFAAPPLPTPSVHDTVLYNPSDMAACLHSLFHDLHPATIAPNSLHSAALEQQHPRTLEEEDKYRVLEEDGASSNQRSHGVYVQLQSSAESARDEKLESDPPGSAATERESALSHKRARQAKEQEGREGAVEEAKRSRATSIHIHGGGGVTALMQPLVYNEEETAAEGGGDQASGGIQLVHLLTTCADAIQKQELGAAAEMVREIWRRLSIAEEGGGVGPMFKVATHFARALDQRILRLTTASTAPLPQPHLPPDVLYSHFYESCPSLKFSHFMANQAILRAFRGHRNVHVLDLDLLHGFQWPALIQALALREEGPPLQLRITTIASAHSTTMDSLRDAGQKLADIARDFKLRFSFKVADSVDHLHPPWRRSGEVLAVNCMFQLHRLLRDPGGGGGAAPIDRFLATIRRLNPEVVTVAEHEANHNSPIFLERFAEALYYYCTMFDSLEEEGAEEEEEGRRWAAEEHLGREIMDIVAMEGEGRVERHEMLWKWRRRMVAAGFKALHLGSDAFTQARLLLSLRSKHGFSVQENSGCLTLAWHTTPLVSASAWHCHNAS